MQVLPRSAMAESPTRRWRSTTNRPTTTNGTRRIPITTNLPIETLTILAATDDVTAKNATADDVIANDVIAPYDVIAAYDVIASIDDGTIDGDDVECVTVTDVDDARDVIEYDVAVVVDDVAVVVAESNGTRTTKDVPVINFHSFEFLQSISIIANS